MCFNDFKGTETILLVDDEQSLLELISQILRRKGYTVFCAESGKQALALLEKENIDLLFSDVIMPEMDGFQLAEIVQKKYPSLKIQLASGFSDDRHLVMNDDKLYKEILNKPYATKKLLKRLRQIFD